MEKSRITASESPEQRVASFLPFGDVRRNTMMPPLARLQDLLLPFLLNQPKAGRWKDVKHLMHPSLPTLRVLLHPVPGESYSK